MANDWHLQLKQLYEKLFCKDKKLRMLILAGIAGIVLILLSEIIPHGSTPVKQQDDSGDRYSQYAARLEKETEELLSSIDGVGRCHVMITLKSSGENVYAKNTQENKSDSSYSGSYEYVLYDGSDGEVPVLLKEYLPAVQGVAVVCDGADSVVVRENVINCVSALYNISVSKISVTKYRN